MGRSVDGGDGDYGSGGVLPGCSSSNLLFEPFAQFAKQGNTLVQTIGYNQHQTSVAHQEETDTNQGATSPNDLINDDIDFDKCFSELFPDLAVAEAGINL